MKLTRITIFVTLEAKSIHHIIYIATLFSALIYIDNRYGLEISC
jgi:hypothetical protein